MGHDTLATSLKTALGPGPYRSFRATSHALQLGDVSPDVWYGTASRPTPGSHPGTSDVVALHVRDNRDPSPSPRSGLPSSGAPIDVYHLAPTGLNSRSKARADELSMMFH